ncbi:DUF4231 domain-containing protein [Streptomyces sp. NPDC051940]|uniref:DUF4231 domain-containing protein n=1 Tax=Streptomyces sp. NPDC051940 TaxID=3155675 RepID=UPI0034124ED0
MGTTGGGAVEDVWRAQNVWSRAAVRQKNVVGRARTAALACGVAAAVLGALAARLLGVSTAAGRPVAFLALLAAGAVPLCLRGADAARLETWARLRSVSETLKSETYLYLAGLGPYGDGARRDAELAARTGRVLADAADLDPLIADIVPAVRPLPPVHDRDSYVRDRLRVQITEYYRPQARVMARRTRQFERAGLALAAVSVVLGAVASVFAVGQAAAWIPVASTVITALAAHAAASRYAAQHLEYSRTAGELARLLTWWEGLVTPTDGDTRHLAEHCEHIISVQNEGWMARLTAAEGAPPA